MSNFPKRCAVSEQCLPDAPYRTQLSILHAEMLHEIGALRATRKPLTDSRIWELALATSSTQGGWESGWNVAFARAIERAHGIGGKP